MYLSLVTTQNTDKVTFESRILCLLELGDKRAILNSKKWQLFSTNSNRNKLHKSVITLSLSRFLFIICTCRPVVFWISLSAVMEYKKRMEIPYHILNGDSLKEKFPKELEGQIIIARECLVDGDVKGDNVDEFFEVRAKFIADFYGDYSVKDYFTHTVSEFEKIKGIKNHSSVYLWFEDDLFCQVNFWFVVYLIFNFVQNCKVFLVRPKIHTEYGFGGLDKSELLQLFENRVQISEMEKIAGLWKSYQQNDTESLIRMAKELEQTFPFILRAVEAHIERIRTKNNPGRPVRALLEIMKELETEEFVPVFREFNKRESIYGFGDLQVKRLLDEIKSKR